MARTASESISRQLESLFEGRSVAGLSDRQLLERFNAARGPAGEAAFAAIVARHGPMVLNVCRQLLGDHHHAEDSFQAVFLVLARRARSIRDPDLLGNWLYGVALRTARCARAQLDRRRKKEEGDAMNLPGSVSTALAEPIAPPAGQPILDRERAEAVHREIDRLPKSFRLPVVLCYFEGLSLDEAARRLRCPAGTLRSRLARARDKLRRTLTLRGIVLPAAAMAAVLESHAVNASVSSTLCNITAHAAIRFATCKAAAPAATALAREVLRSMLAKKMRVTAVGLIALGTVVGVVHLTSSLATNEEPTRRSQRPISRKSSSPEGAHKSPTPGRMLFTGRVLAPNGKPVAHASVDLVAKLRAQSNAEIPEHAAFTLLGQAETNDDGNFRLESPRSSSTDFDELTALAAAPGFGLAWASLNADAPNPVAEMRLHPEQLLRLKLVDASGRPARGVRVSVAAIGRAAEHDRWGVWLGPIPPKGLRAWPRSPKSDDQGSLAILGLDLAPDFPVAYTILDAGYPVEFLTANLGDLEEDEEIQVELKQRPFIGGRVLAADTGRPMPGAVISVTESGSAAFDRTERVRTNDQGHFTISRPDSVYFGLRATAAKGQPYLSADLSGTHELLWGDGAVKTQMDFKLARGVLIQGTVVEFGSGRPLAAAKIHCFARTSGFDTGVQSQNDGSFEFVMPPGKGHILVLGPTHNYITKEVADGRRARAGSTGGVRQYSHAIVDYDLTVGSEKPTLIDIMLHPDKPVRGRIIGPAGQTVEDAVIMTRQQIDRDTLTWLDHGFTRASKGRFELSGFDSEKATPAYFLDADHQWGAAVELQSKQPGEDLTIRLQRCGQASARFVGTDGKPIANLEISPYFRLVMTPGPDRNSRKIDDQAKPAADAACLSNVDPRYYGTQEMEGPLTDAEGKITLPDLIPGAPYRVVDWSTANVPDKGVQVRKDFTVQSGESLDLGDILIEKPLEH